MMFMRLWLHTLTPNFRFIITSKIIRQSHNISSNYLFVFGEAAKIKPLNIAMEINKR